MDSELIEASARYFLTLVRQCFHGENRDTYHKFIALLEKHACSVSSGSIELMFTEVQTLFGSDQYLINKFATFVENYRNIKISSSSDDEVITPLSRNQQLIKNSVDLLNNVSRTLKDQEQINRFIDVVAGFHKPKLVSQRVETVRKKTYKVLKKHPLLIKEWSGFLAEAKVEKVDVGEISEAEVEKVDVGDRSEANVVYKSTAENYHEYMFDFEHAMHKMDLLYHRAVSVKDSAKRLISENMNKDPMERIDVGVYFSAINVKYVNKELKGCRHLLLNKSKLRGKAIRVAKKLRGKAVRVAKRILHCADKKIEKVKKSWSPEKKNMALKMHEEDNQTFDWHNDDDEVPKFDQFGRFLEL